MHDVYDRLLGDLTRAALRPMDTFLLPGNEVQRSDPAACTVAGVGARRPAGGAHTYGPTVSLARVHTQPVAAVGVGSPGAALTLAEFEVIRLTYPSVLHG
jgi:hypothetical protein